MESTKKYFDARGSGAGARIPFHINKLENLGWKVNSRESTVKGVTKVFFSYINPQGKTLKSTKDVERELRAAGSYEEVKKEDEPNPSPKQQQQPESSDDTDSDYEPPEKRKDSDSSDSKTIDRHE